MFEMKPNVEVCLLTMGGGGHSLVLVSIFVSSFVIHSAAVDAYATSSQPEGTHAHGQVALKGEEFLYRRCV